MVTPAGAGHKKVLMKAHFVMNKNCMCIIEPSAAIANKKCELQQTLHQQHHPSTSLVKIIMSPIILSLISSIAIVIKCQSWCHYMCMCVHNLPGSTVPTLWNVASSPSLFTIRFSIQSVERIIQSDLVNLCFTFHQLPTDPLRTYKSLMLLPPLWLWSGIMLLALSKTTRSTFSQWLVEKLCL